MVSQTELKEILLQFLLSEISQPKGDRESGSHGEQTTGKATQVCAVII